MSGWFIPKQEFMRRILGIPSDSKIWDAPGHAEPPWSIARHSAPSVQLDGAWAWQGVSRAGPF